MIDFAILILGISFATVPWVFMWLMVKEYKDDKEWWDRHYGDKR